MRHAFIASAILAATALASDPGTIGVSVSQLYNDQQRTKRGYLQIEFFRKVGQALPPVTHRTTPGANPWTPRSFRFLHAQLPPL